MTESWRSLKFIDIVDYTKKPRNLDLPKLIPFVPMDLVPLEKQKILECNYVESVNSGTYVEDGDLLLAKITPSFENGKQGVLDIGHDFAYATTEVIPLKGKPNVALTDYISLFLKRSEIRVYLAGKMEGSTGRQRLSKSALEDLSVLIPPVTEQAKIVFVLNKIQTAIEQQDKLIKTTTELKKTLMQKLFTEGTKGEKQKQTEIGLVPESWAVKKLGDVLRLNYGYSLPARKRLEGEFPVYGSNGIVGYHNSFLCNSPGIIVGRKGSAGMVHYSEKNFCPIDTTFFIAKNDSKLSFKFLFYLLQFIDLTKLKADVGVPGLNREMAYLELVAVPTSDLEQLEISRTIDCLESKIQCHLEKKRLLGELFKSLLNELMTGQRRVNKIDFATLEKEVAANG